MELRCEGYFILSSWELFICLISYSYIEFILGAKYVYPRTLNRHKMTRGISLI